MFAKRLADVPSDRHTSTPVIPSSAERNTYPFTALSPAGPDEKLPGLMSCSTVPADVPSLVHTSIPPGPVAVNTSPLPALVRLEGEEEPIRAMFLTSTVPAVV